MNPGESMPRRLMETAKLVHLASLVTAAILALLVFAMPAVFGHETLGWTLLGAFALGGLLVLGQIGLLAALAIKRRRIMATPRLSRPDAKRLQFDEPSTPNHEASQ